MLIRKIFLILLFSSMLCTLVTAVTVVSDFKCTSNDGDSTMTHYSYLREPTLQENGYTKGYKAGSFNYLENGSINFTDFIEIYDGQKKAGYVPGDDLNSSVYHKQVVGFEGDKGISEFYGKGFFPSNRAISAWKKIRYDDISYEMDESTGIVNLSGSNPSLRERYNSPVIDVDATVRMGPAKGGEANDYNFKYNATVENGVIEIKDATGWTNRTGARRTDWEQDALMKGNVTVKNDLRAKDLFFPAAGGEEDWLPCCLGGDRPKIEIQGSGWPNSGTYSTLSPAIELPSKKRIENCTLKYDERRGYVVNCTGLSFKNFSCTENNCPGFEGIFYCPGATRVSGRGLEPIEGGPSIRVEKTRYSVNDGFVKYKIAVSNDGTTILENVKVTDILPEGMKLEISKWLSPSDLSAIEDSEEPITDEDMESEAKDKVPDEKIERDTANETNEAWDLTWNIGDMNPTDETRIYLTAVITSESANDMLNEVYVESIYKGSSGDETISDEATTTSKLAVSEEDLRL